MNSNPARANEFFVGRLQCQTNMKLVFHISEDGSDTVISSAFRVIYILVLPKFQLDVKPPSYLAWDQREIPVSICARYCINDYFGKLGLN